MAMNKSVLALAIALEASVASAADFQSGSWVGIEDWQREVCRIETHIQDGVYFLAQQNWQGKFQIGLASRNWNLDSSLKFPGAVVFDSTPPMLLEGAIQHPTMILFSAKNEAELLRRFSHGRELRLTFDETWAVVNLSGSSKAANLLAKCAQRVWPGAGDEVDYQSADESFADFADASKFPLPTTPAIGRCHMDYCSWIEIVEVIRNESVDKGKQVKIRMRWGESSHANDGGYPEKYDSKLEIEWDASFHEISLICSRTTPTIVSNGDVYVLDLREVSGASEAITNLYLEVCHNAPSGTWANTSWLTRNGY